jgi:hypothetical protein
MMTPRHALGGALSAIGCQQPAGHLILLENPRQPEDALNQANGADTAGGHGGLGPLAQGRSDAAPVDI